MADPEEVWEPGLTDGHRCDFCGGPAPVWVYPTRTHAVYELQDDHDETLVTGMSQGGWLACAACRTFIERIRSAVDRERFARRCATVIAGRLRIPQAETLPQVRSIHAGFFQNRLGDGRPWTAADASEPPPPPIVVT